MHYFYDFYRNHLKTHKEKNDNFLYELALKRGKTHGWYPHDWTIKDYEQHLFRTGQLI